MTTRRKIDSLVVIGVGAAFQWFFMFTKHDPALRPIIPFGNDPYDALGSFATIVNILLFLLLLWRTFRSYRGRVPSPEQIQYLRRTQAAVLLLIIVTLAADAVAMVRHPHMWIATRAQNKLLVVCAGMTAISLAALALIRASSQDRMPTQDQNRTTSVAVISILFVVILSVYPEQWINRMSTHFVTVLIGDLLLFAPAAVLLQFLFPDVMGLGAAGGQTKSRSTSSYVWIGSTVFALLIGAWLFVAEMTEGGAYAPPLRMRLFVASVYIGLTLAGVFIALVFLSRPLGLAQRKTLSS